MSELTSGIMLYQPKGGTETLAEFHLLSTTRATQFKSLRCLKLRQTPTTIAVDMIPQLIFDTGTGRRITRFRRNRTPSRVSPQKTVSAVASKSVCRYILSRMSVRRFLMSCACNPTTRSRSESYHVSFSTVAITASGVIASRFSRARSGCASHSLDDSVFINEHSLRAITACLSHVGAHWIRFEAPNRATVGVLTAVLRVHRSRIVADV